MAGWEDAPIVMHGPNAAPWERAPIVRPANRRVADGILDSLAAGWQGSATGLMVRGRLPDIVLDANESKWYEKAAAGFGQVMSEIPEMIPGAVAGAAAGTAAAGPLGGVIGGGAGAFAAPAAIREALIQAYTKGEVRNSADFLERAAIVLKSTGKEAVIGAATMGAGTAVARGVGAALAPQIGTAMTAGTARAAISTAQVGAEIGTMVTAPAFMEGKLPEPEDFVNAAVVLLGVKGALSGATKLSRVYAKTGKTPLEVVADARRDPTIVADLGGQRPAPPAFDNVDFGIRSLRENDTMPQGVPVISRTQGGLKTVSIGGEVVAYMDVRLTGNEVTIAKIETLPVARRQGFATMLVDDLFAEHAGKKVTTTMRTDDGAALFKTYPQGEGNQIAARSAASGIPRAYEPLAREELVRASIPDPVKVAEVMANPEGKITLGKEPNHINYRYLEAPDEVKAIHAKISETFSAEIAAARGRETWVETQARAMEVIKERLAGMTPEQKVAERAKPFDQLAAESMATSAMLQRAAYDVQEAASLVRQKGSQATEADTRTLVSAIETMALLEAVDQGNAANIARALNARKAARETNELAGEIKKLTDKYGDPQVLADMIGRIENEPAMRKFARDAGKATTWEKIVEAYKASLVSGPITQIANIVGNTTFMAVRPLVDTVGAGIGLVRGDAGRTRAAEPVARVLGNIQGFAEAMKIAGEALYEKPFRTLAMLDIQQTGGKAEQRRDAIEGKLGTFVRTPFRALATADGLFRLMNERGEAWTQAVRQAGREGLTLGTREHRERAAELVQHPTAKMQEAIEAAGLRFTFNAPLGEKGQAVQNLIRQWHLEWAIPFVRTPGNILKELTRMTPLAPLVKEWRADLAAGGARADKAVGEIMVGSAIAGGVTAYAFAGLISGAGEPDPNKRRVKMAAGWQPYSVKIGDTWYSYQRLQPVGTLIGIAADMAEVWDHMNPEESDKIPKMISVAFANAVTSQTFLQGLTNIINGMSDPGRYGERFLGQLAGSVVPGILSQTAQVRDPFVREIDSMLDAVKNRVPGLRETLLPARDAFGQPISNKERVGVLSPVTKVKESDDPVRKEAARLGVGVAKAPDDIILPAGRDRKLGKVELTPEQQDVFASTSGQLAHQVLEPIVNSGAWAGLPDMVKKRIYDTVFERSRKAGAAAALPAEQRALEAARIHDELARRLGL